MSRWMARATFLVLLAEVCSTASAQNDEADHAVVLDPRGSSAAAAPNEPNQWIDRAHRGLHAVVWRSAMRIDQWFGAEMPEQAYRERARGSITPVLLWDEFGGPDQKFRFRAKLPLPHLDERYDAFIGTFSRDEFVTEREQESGAIPRQHARGEVEEDQTLVGIRYRDPKQGGRFEANAGLRIRSPIDPFVKAGYRYERGRRERVLLSLRETLFWQNSEQFGLTSRVDLERMFGDTWLVRWTGSGTISEESAGVRGYTALTAYRGLPSRRAVGAQLFTAGEFDAAVPLGEYGAKMAYRQSVLREWLVLEIRPSVTWPKDRPEQPRKASWGLGIGFEMFFGMDEFQARPATF